MPPRAHNDGKGVVVAVFGPTGVGKTAVAVELAQALGVRVISADSMQLYRGFPVLTNQPTPRELERAPHALISVTAPDEEWSAVAYGAQARRLIEKDLGQRGWALAVGGTGLYLRAALAPLASPPAEDPILRARLDLRARTEGPEALHADLAVLDPEAAAGIHPRNLPRVVRALEVVTAAGGPAWSGRDDLWRPVYPHPTLLVGLVRDREELARRVEARAVRMIEEGAPDEVARYRVAGERAREEPGLGARGIEKAIGYRELCLLLDGRADPDETAQRIAVATRRYAKRQLTWLKKLSDAVIMDASHREPADVAAEILRRAETLARPTTE